jgi:ribose/xylose/arabinose/galactoside ABC-type transport system permease subunit
LFVVVGGIGYLAGVRNLLYLLLGALIVSGVLSYLLLTRQRVAFSEAVARGVRRRGGVLRERWQRRPQPFADRRAREDSYAEAFQAEQATRRPR